MLDFRGKEITVGSTVVYPGRRGSSMWLNQGRVTAIREFPHQLVIERQPNGVWEKSRIVTITAACFGRLAVL